METIDELQTFLGTATGENIRRRLLDRGEARAIIRRAGQLPDDAPALGETLDTDLSEYAFSLLRASLTLREREGSDDIWRDGFFKAANAFEALVRNGSPQTPERGFWRAMGAASYHLSGYSAMAYSLLSQREEDPNFAPGELALARLLLRDLRTLRSEAQAWLLDPVHQDEDVRERLEDGGTDFEDAISEILTTTIYRALAFLVTALRVARDFGVISLWWIIRVALNVIGDLWGNSLNRILPMEGPRGAAQYGRLRELFLASLYARDIAEVELWPSQLEAAVRATDLDDDLVVSLPTSAGKTRIAEICTLMTLSAERRVFIVTPLRALSAQTEKSFRRTFGPLGFSVSSLYGASGAMPDDEDALRTREIVIATPEKLDFALRNDQELIDDVGLIVLDEGHLIGPGERELRYEVLVQRLLRRADAGQRRIVCLSAILPDGEQLDDLTAWIRSDADGVAVKSEWRPTRQRFGTLAWTGQTGRLTFDSNDDGPYIHKFVERQPPIPPRRTPFPKDNPELTLAAAWRFADEGKRTLVFCTQRNHVESYARKIVDLSGRGFLPPLLGDTAAIVRAEAIGAEWLGADHPAVQCLRVGVAIHHARLPNPFLREIERLLTEGVLTVTVASPTLAQGLNLNAAVLLIPSLYRTGVQLSGEEFANVAGRAGRAFVDLEGLIVHVMYKPERWRRRAWSDLVISSKARSLESGLIRIAAEILRRLARGGILNQADAFEYLANSREAWDIQVDEEGDEPLEQLLVLCSQSLFRFPDLGDDGFGRSRPDEWLGVFVSPIDVVGDGLDELSDAGDGEAFELPSREFTEEALNEIQPRGGGRGEVELHSRVFLEPYPNSRMLVRSVVVENDVDVELGRDGPLDLTEESQEFLMPMARHAFVEDLASGHVQSSEEGRGTVTFVVMRHRSSTPFLQGQARLGAVQGLDLALLVESEDHGPLRGVDVEAHHITELLDELGIRGQLEVVDAVRLKAMSLPDTRYRGRMHAYFLGHETATPVRRVSRLVLERLANDLSFVLRSDLPWPTRARSILEQGLDPVRLIAIEPLRNRGPGHTHRSTDRRPRKPLCGGKDDLGPLNHALRRGPFVHQLLQTPALSATQPNPTNWQSHADNLPHGIQYARDLCYTTLGSQRPREGGELGKGWNFPPLSPRMVYVCGLTKEHV